MAGENKIDWKLIVIILATVVISTMGSAYSTYRFLCHWSEKHEVGAAQQVVSKKDNFSVGYTYDAGTFTVNIIDERGNGTTRYMRTGVVLAAKNEEIIKELQRREPQVRDVIIAGLRSRTYQEVMSRDGMQLLKQDVLESLNSILGYYQVSDVYFTDFVVQ